MEYFENNQVKQVVKVKGVQKKFMNMNLLMSMVRHSKAAEGEEKEIMYDEDGTEI